MDSYTSFAQVYDTFMDNIPYKEGCAYLCRLLAEYGITDGLLAELGCGTGTLTELLSECGFDMIGIDNSPDMLEIAMDKRAESGHDILYLLQDMREFELYGTVRGIISFCDSINYITDPRELLTVFRLVNNYLDPQGIFIFDFNTDYKYREVIGNTTITENREDCSFIWENYYDKEEQINEYDLTLFIREEKQEQLYRKFEETHYQRGYSLEQMQTFVEEAGMEFLAAYDAETKQAPTAESERIYIIAGEKGK